jgi:RNA polymerase sigma-70 factor, ECF subfamily
MGWMDEVRNLPDERIVALVRAGGRDDFEILMRRHNQRVYRAVRAFLRDEAEVEDVMQQAYLRAFLHLDQLAEGAKIATWLVRIAVNLAIDRLRSRRRLAEASLSDEESGRDEVVSTSRSPESELGDRELAALLEDALADLPEIYRAVFVLREVEGMSTEEVGEALAISEPAVKVRLHRAKNRLKKRLLARVGRAVGDVFTFEAPRCDRVVAGVLGQLRRDP